MFRVRGLRAGRNELSGRRPGSFVLWVLRGLLRRLTSRTFGFWPKAGVWVVPADYNAPIPALDLDRQRHHRASVLAGVDLRIPEQLDTLTRFASSYGHEWSAMAADPTPNAWDYYHHNESFSRVDAELTHAFVRDLKPRRIVEVGSGMSTRLLAHAGRSNASEGHAFEMTVIDPFPGTVVVDGVPGVTRLIQAPVETQSLELFELEPNDVLFVDSTHVLKAGGDVEFLLFEVLPRLKPGVVVHFHDVYLPFDYPPQIYASRWFWTEQYALRALLTNNPQLRVLWSSFAVYRRHPDDLVAALPGLTIQREGGPASLWVRIEATS